MKKLVLAITIAAMAVSGAALATSWQDNVGVYLDPLATEVCVDASAGIGVHHAYLVLDKMTSAGVGGFELNLAFEGPLSASNFVFPAGSGALNMQQAPTFMVGFGAPLMAVDRKVVLMEFDVLVYSANPVNWVGGFGYVYIKEIFFHSLPEELPAYLSDAGELKPMHNSTGLESDPVMIFSLSGSCDGVVATDETSWDSLKSLYR